MAIIRCPYCHAIIDENDKYCNNCGTQLLFPEDEEVEEEIPGEKIVDAEENEEEKDYDLGEAEPEASTGPLEDGREVRTEEERTGELVSGPLEGSGSGATGEVIQDAFGAEAALGQKEAEPEEAVLVEEAAAPEEETKAYPVQPPEEAGPKDETAEIAPPAEAPERLAMETGPAREKRDDVETSEAPFGEFERAAEASAAAPPSVPPTFDTRELDGIGKTVELGKDRLEKMISVMAEKQQDRAGEGAAEPEKKTGTLPPWASRIKGAVPAAEAEAAPPAGRRFDPGRTAESAAQEAPTGIAETEEEIFPRRKPPDSGVGLPERIAQATLPFEAVSAREEKEDELGDGTPFGPAVFPARPEPSEEMEERRPAGKEPVGVMTVEPGGEPYEEAVRPPFHFSVYLKAKTFDILFVGVFWLVALWLAARSMDATLFEILSVTSAPVLVLYGVYVGLYFFLFKFFLGETLGDRLFRERD